MGEAAGGGERLAQPQSRLTRGGGGLVKWLAAREVAFRAARAGFVELRRVARWEVRQDARGGALGG